MRVRTMNIQRHYSPLACIHTLCDCLILLRAESVALAFIYIEARRSTFYIQTGTADPPPQLNRQKSRDHFYWNSPAVHQSLIIERGLHRNRAYRIYETLHLINNDRLNIHTRNTIRFDGFYCSPAQNRYVIYFTQFSCGKARRIRGTLAPCVPDRTRMPLSATKRTCR